MKKILSASIILLGLTSTALKAVPPVPQPPELPPPIMAAIVPPVPQPPEQPPPVSKDNSD